MIKPSVVLGTESWLDGDVTNTEVFPSCYTCFRNDRNRQGGGVFILVDSSISCSALDIGGGTCEDVWCKIRLPNGKTLSVCSFYRPPTSSTAVMTDFSKTLETVNTDYLVIGGDFNIPELSWNNQFPNSRATSAVAKEMLNMLSNFSLTQMVTEGTRQNNILDLFLTNQPNWVKRVLVVPGISDHKAVLCEMKLTYEKTQTSVSRKMYNYSQGDVNQIGFALQEFFPEFEQLSGGASTIEELWLLFRAKMLELQEKYVPSWVQTSHRTKSKPWFNGQLRRLTNKRNRIYTKFKRKPTSKNCEQLKCITKLLQTKIRQTKKRIFP